MRAIAISDFGADPELIQAPEPEPRPGELLVRLRAAAYNPVDHKIATGAMKDRMSPRFPFIMGQDGAGVVTAVGREVSGFRPGDEVYGRFTDPARGLGSYAEYGVVAQDGPVARMPKGMIPEQAAAVPTATETARDLVEVARLDEGQTVLIVGATGGVGQSAIQLAALRGARARPGGVICSVLHALDPDALAARELRGVNVINRLTPQVLSDLADLIDAGRLRVRVQAQVPLERAPAALAGLATGHARGKTVITM